jgi:type VI secretion system protein ImpM
MSEFTAEGPGFFGKVRTHGDFVSRRLPVEFLTPWDRWLQEGMLFSRQALGEQWLSVYLNAPVRCFAVGADICGAAAWVGVLMPGVDRVGRYYPFTIAAPIAQNELAAWLARGQAWYAGIAKHALSTLAADFVLEQFDAELNALGPVVSMSATEQAGIVEPGAATKAGDGEPEETTEWLASHVAPGCSVWWSTQGEPLLLRSDTCLPEARQFVALLDPACSGRPRLS